MPKWEAVEGHLATPAGFRAAAASAGIKKEPGALDLALIVSDSPDTSAAGLFTTNQVAAAPVVLSRRNLRASNGRARAIVVNSGNANACTGEPGIQTARQVAARTAKLLGLQVQQVLVASTGIIGVLLRSELILNHLSALKKNLSVENAEPVARAIMTTDTFPKSLVLRGEFGGRPVHLAGVAKGSGMIHPRMGTMLSFITTDVAVVPAVLQRLLRSAVDSSFNRITVDGDTSTNDTVLMLANGRSGESITAGSQSYAQFRTGLFELCETLAKMIARDGEGAKKLVRVEVCGATRVAAAERIARAIANSPLVKTAIAGSDANWGRMICAAGYSGVRFDPSKLDLYVNGLALVRGGVDAGFLETVARRELDRKEVTIRLDLHQGKASAHMWTCDLTHDYITINASYRT